MGPTNPNRFIEPAFYLNGDHQRTPAEEFDSAELVARGIAEHARSVCGARHSQGGNPKAVGLVNADGDQVILSLNRANAYGLTIAHVVERSTIPVRTGLPPEGKRPIIRIEWDIRRGKANLFNERNGVPIPPSEYWQVAEVVNLF